jgi:hypothetical protein
LLEKVAHALLGLDAPLFFILVNQRGVFQITDCFFENRDVALVFLCSLIPGGGLFLGLTQAVFEVHVRFLHGFVFVAQVDAFLPEPGDGALKIFDLFVFLDHLVVLG